MSAITDELERLIARHEAAEKESIASFDLRGATTHLIRANAVHEALMLVRSIELRQLQQEVEQMNKESRT